MGSKPRHGESRGIGRTVEYTAWQSMRYRCLNPRSKKYRLYGGRGITICERWSSYECFLADMGRRPSAEHSLDRTDNDGNYELRNCRWATRSEQSRNRRPHKWGKLAEYCKSGEHKYEPGSYYVEDGKRICRECRLRTERRRRARRRAARLRIAS
jgi:hypothetical protein